MGDLIEVIVKARPDRDAVTLGFYADWEQAIKVAFDFARTAAVDPLVNAIDITIRVAEVPGREVTNEHDEDA